MIGILQSKNVRTKYDKKICRLTIDVPYYAIKKRDVDGVDALEWIDQRVGGEMGLELTTLEAQEQERLYTDE